MGTQVVPSSPGGGKAGSQPQDLVAKLVQIEVCGSTWGHKGTPTMARGRKK